MNLEDLDLLAFLDHHDISYLTHGKNIGDGWVGVNPCPDCGDDRNHFGINIGNKSINCWICDIDGTLIKFLMMTMHINYEEAIELIEDFDEQRDLLEDIDVAESVQIIFKPKKKTKKKKEPEVYVPVLPGDRITHPLVESYPALDQYLKRRRITVEMCRRHKFRFDHDSYRIIMPIFDKRGIKVAYQGRDITGRALLKIITQPKGVKLSKHIYNLHNWGEQRFAIIVEGIMDVLRIEHLLHKHYHTNDVIVLACFTNKPSFEQLSLLTPYKDEEIFVMMDGDAWFNYKEFEEGIVRVEPLILPPKKDPASLTDQEFLDLQLGSFLK